jgi:isoleucyl-tRNA synthetase
MLCDIEDLPGEWNNSAIREEWDKITSLRDIVLKEVEVAKEKEVIKDPLQAAVTITASSREILDFLKKNEDKWKEYFIVSSVKFSGPQELSGGQPFSGGQLKVEVTPARGDKCVRCWLISPAVGKDSEHEELCSRCSGIVRELEKS